MNITVRQNWMMGDSSEVTIETLNAKLDSDFLDKKESKDLAVKINQPHEKLDSPQF